MLSTRTCVTHPTLLTAEEIHTLLDELSGWNLAINNQSIYRNDTFADFHQVMAFVNAVAYIAHQQNHHPELSVSYNRVTITYNTHDVGGLSINDFICAARVSALIA